MASIICGKCTRTHGSVAEVKACHAGVTVQAFDRLPENLGAAKVAYTAPRPAPIAAPVEASTYRPGASAPLSTLEKAVPAGRYAVTEGGVLKFFVVDKPTEGKWKGYTFLKIQASDDTFPVKDRARRVVILSAIAQDPEAASKRYGKEIGKCGVCNRTLTDPDSIAAGIGPVCASKMGW